MEMYKDAGGQVEFYLRTAGATPVQLTKGDISTLTLTLRDRKTGAVINSRQSQNIKDANNVTGTTGGIWTWLLQVADNPIKDPTLRTEEHRAIITWVTTANVTGRWEIPISVINTDRVGY